MPIVVTVHIPFVMKYVCCRHHHHRSDPTRKTLFLSPISLFVVVAIAIYYFAHWYTLYNICIHLYSHLSAGFPIKKPIYPRVVFFPRRSAVLCFCSNSFSFCCAFYRSFSSLSLISLILYSVYKFQIKTYVLYTQFASLFFLNYI